MKTTNENFDLEKCREIRLGQLYETLLKDKDLCALFEASKNKLVTRLASVIESDDFPTPARSLEEYFVHRIVRYKPLFFTRHKNGYVDGFITFDIKDVNGKPEITELVICPFHDEETSVIRYIDFYFANMVTTYASSIKWNAPLGSVYEIAYDACITDFDGERDVVDGKVVYTVEVESKNE